jgi:hypothetical protein
MRKLLCIVFTAITAVANCQTAIITKSEKEIIPEGITISPADKKIYVSSIGLMKIIGIDQSGRHRDFIKSGQDGFLEGLGMKIDEEKQWLWVVSNHREGKQYSSAVHAFDLKTGTMRQRWVVNDTARHLFNDLILHPNNKIYITDTFAATLYEYDPAKKSLDVFMKDAMLSNANGIACNAKGEVIIATRDGLVKLNVESKKMDPLVYKDSRKAQWMDGIVFWKDNIIGVADAGIMQYKLDNTNDHILSEKVIDTAVQNKFFHDPTTLALLGNDIYVVANSYLSVYNQNGEKIKGVEEKLGSVIVLKYELKN